MSENRRAGHPGAEDLDRLARYLAGELIGYQAARVRAHLAGCAACRLELQGLARFQELDGDEELAKESGWETARAVLDARLRAADLATPAPRAPIRASGARRRLRSAARWWVPAAAAAAVALIVVGVERGPLDGVSVPRGGVRAAATIVVRQPLGELATAPDTFAWRSTPPCERYTLEVYTLELRTVLRREVLADSSYVLPDSLRRLLAPGATYLWNVQGFHDLEPDGSMPEAWFRIVP